MANNDGPGAPLAGHVTRFAIRSNRDAQLIPDMPPEQSSEFHVSTTVNFTTRHGHIQTEEVTLYFQLDILSDSPAEERANLAELFHDIGFTSGLLGSDTVRDTIVDFCLRCLPRVPPRRHIMHMFAGVDVVLYSIPDEFEGDFVPRVEPASQEEIEQLEIVKMPDEAAAIVTCPICLEEVSTGSEAIRLPCSHKFHENCIFSWLRISKICPLCRFGI